MTDLLSAIGPAVPFLAVLATVLAVLVLANALLERRYGAAPGARFRIPLVMLTLSLVGLVAIIMALPVSETLRGQLLSLLGVLLSASIALSATTLLGNAMAGILLRAVGAFGMGDFVQVGEHFGRVSERGLFHTEIQTEDRDLTTLPNMYLVSNPVRVIGGSGTVVSARLSLGYDVGRGQVESLLLAAAEKTGLEDPFVHVVDLGDFSITYRAAGLLTDVSQILTTRSRLRAAIMDELHASGIEIVSPNFMNTRSLTETARILPPTEPVQTSVEAVGAAESVAFDKAEEAVVLEQLGSGHEELASEIATLEDELSRAEGEEERSRIEERLTIVRAAREQLDRPPEPAQEVTTLPAPGGSSEPQP